MTEDKPDIDSADDKRVVNGGAVASITATTVNILYGSDNVDEKKANPAKTLKRQLGWGTAAVLYQQSASAFLNGNNKEAGEKFVMATSNAVKSSEKAVHEIAVLAEKTKLGRMASGAFSAGVSKIPLAGPGINMGIASIAAAEEKHQEKADGTLLVGGCQAYGMAAGAIIGTVVATPGAGTAAGAFIGSEVMSEICAQFWKHVSPSNVKVKGSSAVALYNASGIGEAVEEGAKLLDSKVSLHETKASVDQPVNITISLPQSPVHKSFVK